MTIREIREEEVNLLHECLERLADHHNAVSVHFKGSYPLHDNRTTMEDFRQRLVSGTSRIAVIGDEKIRGFCKIDLYQAYGKLDYLMVLEEYRGKGYGRLLMDWAMQCFKDNRIQSVEVKVVDGNPALHLYEKYGFLMASHILCRKI